ncbi:MAG: single-stranded DNA-binding protein [Saccharofermentans sp.]|nr:single-stranded DNA-binding protein [Saccharofermentans sp.]
MNKVELVGRLTKDPEIKLTSNQTQFCNFTVAVDRRFKDANGQRQADFINCVAWRQTAVFIQKYFHKGNRIGLVGSIQTRTYDDQNGQKRYVTEVVIDEAEFVDSTGSAAGDSYRPEPAAPAQSYNPPMPPAPPAPVADSVAASAPTAPNMQIDAPVSGGFDEGPSGELPFEI